MAGIEAGMPLLHQHGTKLKPINFSALSADSPCSLRKYFLVFAFFGVFGVFGG